MRVTATETVVLIFLLAASSQRGAAATGGVEDSSSSGGSGSCEDASTSSSGTFYGLDEAHHRAVSAIRSTIQERQPPDQLITLRKRKRSGHTMRSEAYKKDTLMVDISELDRIVSVKTRDAEDAEEAVDGDHVGLQPGGSAWVEPLASMEKLVQELLPMGLIPCVVPEFRGITVGGSVQGLAAESSSFRQGFFHDTALRYEVVLGTGEVMMVSAQEDEAGGADLFHGIAGSYGSLAIITAAEIRLCKALPFVKVTTTWYESALEAAEVFKMLKGKGDATNSRGGESDGDGGKGTAGEGGENVAFLEGFGFGPTSFVSVEGSFSSRDDAEAAEHPTHSLSSFYSPWFYKLVEWSQPSATTTNQDPSPASAAASANPSRSNGSTRSFFLSTEDYLFRHDRGAFWMASFKVPHSVGRLFGDGLSSASLFALSKALPWAFPTHQLVLQDFMLPVDEMPGFVSYLQDKVELWPLWLLPMHNQQLKENILSVPGDRGMYCNVGAYGLPRKSSTYAFQRDNIEMEGVLTAAGGRKVFYSHAYYTREHFAQLYDMEAYGELRRRYGGQSGFRDVYDKVITVGMNL